MGTHEAHVPSTPSYEEFTPSTLFRYFRDLWNSVQKGEVSYREAVSRLPASLAPLVAGSPGRIGFTAQGASGVPSEIWLAPIWHLNGMAQAVLALGEQYKRTENASVQQALIYQWKMLHGFVYSAVMWEPRPYWFEIMVSDEGNIENLIIWALITGGSHYDKVSEHETWTADAWESDMAVQELVDAFREACSDAREVNIDWHITATY